MGYRHKIRLIFFKTVEMYVYYLKGTSLKLKIFSRVEEANKNKDQGQKEKNKEKIYGKIEKVEK